MNNFEIQEIGFVALGRATVPGETLDTPNKIKKVQRNIQV